MQISVKKKLLFLLDNGKETVIHCSEADAIARANGMLYAEQITKKYNEKTLVIDDETLKIKEIQEDFI